MPRETRDVSPLDDPQRVRAADGRVLHVPGEWELLPPGDAGLTRKLKSLGPTWTVKIRRRKRLESRGVWAPAANVAEARRLVEAQRTDPAYAKRRSADSQRREKIQAAYVEEFEAELRTFLAFDARHADLEGALARAVAAHATPVGSGTVARTKRISLERRAEAAVIAWLRHQTTAYDSMKVARVKGRRREIRRMLADQSRQLLDDYRRGETVDATSCLLRRALEAGDQRGEGQGSTSS